MVIREYNTGDLSEIYRLFYETVHSVNLKDYTRAQADAWAPFDYDREKWNNSLIENYCVVASENNTITGFGDIDESGYLNRLYVHRDFQNRGIATAICDELESHSEGNIIRVHASVTAKPFFEKRNYIVIKEQFVKRNEILLKNFIMIKTKINNFKDMR